MGENAFADVLDTMAEMAAKKMQDINLLCTAVLKSIKDARRNPDEYVSAVFKGADGLKWQNKGTATPVRGSELTNEKLKTALQTKREFDAKEWREFGVHNLRYDHYIESGGNYYQPVADGNSKLMTDAIKAFESKKEDKLANAIIEALNGVFSAVLTAAR